MQATKIEAPRTASRRHPSPYRPEREPGGRLRDDRDLSFGGDPATSAAGRGDEYRTNPDISPLYGDLNDLPPALLIVGTLDIVLEHSLAMAARLSGRARGHVV